MKVLNLFKQIIAENSRFEILFDTLTKPSKDKEGNKVPAKLTDADFFALVEADPTTRTNEVELNISNKKDFAKVKAGKYTQWLIKSFLSILPERPADAAGYQKELKELKDRFLEDLYKVTIDLQKFEKFKNRLPEDKRDINKLSPTELYELVKDFSLEKTKASAEEKKEASKTYQHPGADIVFKGAKWTVARIVDSGKLGKDAACFYGGYYLEPPKGETRWCTSSPGLNWFDRYIKDGPLYVIIPNETTGKLGEKSGLPAHRYQFHFQSNQFMDEHDRNQDLISLLNGPMEELKEYFKPEFAKNLSVGGEKKLVIDNLRHGAVGKFVALYGMDEIFKNLSPELEDLQIVNREKDDLNIKLPEDMGKFKNLQHILLDNCVSHIPESICECKELRFVTIMNCPNLKSIPSCIVDLPRLCFVNLKGTTNVKIPSHFTEKCDFMGEGMWDIKED